MTPQEAERWDVLNASVDRLIAERDQLKEELETERMRVVGCGVAALCNTERTAVDRITSDNPYWSASYGDVCAAVDREMELRKERDQLRAENEKLREELSSVSECRNTLSPQPPKESGEV